MTLNPQIEGFSVFFNFRLWHTFEQWIVPKLLPRFKEFSIQRPQIQVLLQDVQVAGQMLSHFM